MMVNKDLKTGESCHTIINCDEDDFLIAASSCLRISCVLMCSIITNMICPAVSKKLKGLTIFSFLLFPEMRTAKAR